MFNQIKLILMFCLLWCGTSVNSSAEPITEFQEQMEKLKGRIVYVDFWASWCTPCRKSFPWLNQLQQQYQHQDFTVLSINLDNKADLAAEFLQTTPANFHIIFDPSGALMRKFNISGLPASILFNKAGQLVSRHSGFNPLKQQQYQQEILSLL
jgi:thiol-disulfide isomerase/thioredoxin